MNLFRNFKPPRDFEKYSFLLGKGNSESSKYLRANMTFVWYSTPIAQKNRKSRQLKICF